MNGLPGDGKAGVQTGEFGVITEAGFESLQRSAGIWKRVTLAGEGPSSVIGGLDPPIHALTSTARRNGATRFVPDADPDRNGSAGQARR